MTKRRHVENPENLGDADLALRLAEDNAARERRLVERGRGAFMPQVNRILAERLAVYLEHLLDERGILAVAMLDYEALRSEQLDEAEKTLARLEITGGIAEAVEHRIVMPGHNGG